MTDSRPDTDASAEDTRPDSHTGAENTRSPAPVRPVEDTQPLDPVRLGAYFVLMEAVSLLQHQVEQQLRAEGGITYVQFQLLARLAHAHGPLTMTELADGVVYSRSGLTYQAGLLEKAGLVTRGPSPDDERATLVTVTGDGRALVDRVLPGHVQVTRQLLFDSLTDDDLHHLGDIMTRVRDHMRAQPPRSAAPARDAPHGPAPDRVATGRRSPARPSRTPPTAPRRHPPTPAASRRVTRPGRPPSPGAPRGPTATEPPARDRARPTTQGAPAGRGLRASSVLSSISMIDHLYKVDLWHSSGSGAFVARLPGAHPSSIRTDLTIL